MNSAIEQLRAKGWLAQSEREYFVLPDFPNIGPGIPKGGITELFGPAGGGKTAFLLQLLATHKNTRVAWVGRNTTFYPCALSQWHLDWQRFLFIEAKNKEDFVWAILQILRSQIFAFLIVRPQHFLLEERDLRRLQLATERARCALLFIKEQPERTALWPLRLQLEIRRPFRPDTLEIHQEDIIVWKGLGRNRWERHIATATQIFKTQITKESATGTASGFFDAPRWQWPLNASMHNVEALVTGATASNESWSELATSWSPNQNKKQPNYSSLAPRQKLIPKEKLQTPRQVNPMARSVPRIQAV